MGEALACDRVEYITGDGRLDVQHGWRCLAIAPKGRFANGHLVQSDRQGEALRVQIPTRWLAQAQEGVEVGVGARGDVVGRCAAQREIEQNELQFSRAAFSAFSDTDVFWLEVAVGHALVFEVVDDLDQLFAKALQQVQLQSAVFLDFLRQGFGTGAAHQQCSATGY